MERDQVTDLLRQSREAEREDRDRAELFKPLVASEPWRMFVAMLDRRLQLFSDTLLAPAGSQDALVAQEFVKGAMFGLVLARDLPAITIESMKRVEVDEELVDDS